MKTYNPLEKLKEKILSDGGFCNSHSHLDRAYSINEKDLDYTVYEQLHEKWKLVDEYKRNSSEEDYYNHIALALFEQKNFGVTSCLSFIDLDEVCEERAINAAIKAKKYAKEHLSIDFVIACQTLKGVLSKNSRMLLEKNIEKFDVIGSLPAADSDIEKHLDVVLGWGKSLGKRVHVHVDQLNKVEERETEILIDKISEHGMEGRVTAVHSISLACHPKQYRYNIYSKSKDVGLSFISCPSAWIDHRRTETLSVTHNAVTPVDEMLQFGLTVAIGSDNIHDIYKPFSDGNMMTELRFLLESTHCYNMKELCKIAGENGRSIIGLSDGTIG